MKLNGNLKKVRAKGFVVKEADAHTLQIDIDGAKALRRYGWSYWQLEQGGMTKGWREKLVPSKSPRHVHIYIRTPDAKPIMERIALQAILGSDLKREGFDYIRAKKRSRSPIVLFERRILGTASRCKLRKQSQPKPGVARGLAERPHKTFWKHPLND